MASNLLKLFLILDVALPFGPRHGSLHRLEDFHELFILSVDATHFPASECDVHGRGLVQCLRDRLGNHHAEELFLGGLGGL